MELHRFFRYAIEKMCKEKKSLNHFNIKCCKEIGELLFYRFLVSDEAQTESIKLNEPTQREKLDKLKEIGVFDLDFFSVDPRGNGASQREQARFLASIIGGHEANIRKYLYNMRKEK